MSPNAIASVLDLDESYFTKDAQTLQHEAIEEAMGGWWRDSQQTLEQRLAWWREARFGCFAHWGVYSVLQGEWRGEVFHGYAEHIQRHFMITQEEYRKHVVERFNPVNFDAEAWIRLLHEAGVKMFAITAKHHDGFAMWDSKVSDYNIVKATPFARDPMPELKAACDKYGMKFGFYYSHAFDWGEAFGPGNDWEYDNPGGDRMIKGGYDWWDVTPELRRPIVENYVNAKSIPQILELIEGYDPEFLWFDTPPKLPFHENMRILKAIRQASPDIIVNGRLARCPGYNFGDYLNTGDRAGEFFMRDGDWESIPTTNESYGHSVHDRSHKSAEFFVQLLAKATSRSGNILINLGPMANGEIDPVDVDIFEGIGAWMKDNGEAIYGTRKSGLPLQNWGVTNSRDGKVYLHVFNWPSDGRLTVAGMKSDPEQITTLVGGHPIEWSRTGDLDIELVLPAEYQRAKDTVLVMTCAQPLDADQVRVLDARSTRLLAFDAERLARPFTEVRQEVATVEIDGEVVDDPDAQALGSSVKDAEILTGDDTKLGYGDGKIAIPRYFVWNWISPKQWLEWQVRVPTASRVSVALHYVGGGQVVGGAYRLRIADAEFEGAVAGDTGPDAIQVAPLGEVSLQPGVVTISLEALEVGQGELMRPLELVLTVIDQ